MKITTVRKNKLRTLCAFIFSEALIFASLQNVAFAENSADYISVPPLINTSSSGDKPNVLFILDNSNSMDEAPTGQAVGSANAGSKSEIARNAIKDIISNFSGSSRMGLMGYQQNNVNKRRLHDSQYDASYNPANYDPDFTGDRASTTKRYRVPNPSSSGNYIYYNVALPFYSSSNYGSKFCYSTTADFDNGSEDAVSGPWDYYDCYTRKTGTSDGRSGLSSRWAGFGFAPTDSDYAQNILDFGTNLTWQYVSDTWFSNSSPGQGYLHVEIDDVDAAQLSLLTNKLATSQFSSSSDTPLRNAGLTPIEGSLESAAAYFDGSLSSSESVTSGTPSAPPANTCAQQDYVILVTDGLPNVDKNGNLITDTSTAIARAADEAEDLLDDGIRTYVIGFALPTGVDSALLDTIAAAGGTGSTYLADDSETLLNSLESIFLSFANRDASSSSSAVLANNSRGEGAVFQAIYSPVKEDALGNEVSWVGSLFGLFLDENGYIREDTNSDRQLDDYLTDRVAHYYFDEVLDKTRVKLFYGPDADTPPNVDNDTEDGIVDVEDLATLWEARDLLGELTDVLTQRAYGDNAADGRYIISSVDGESLLDFVQLSDEQVAALVDVQTAAAEALADMTALYNVAQAQFDGAQQAVIDLATQRDAVIVLRDAAQADVTTAEGVVTGANTALTSAQSNLTSAESTYSSFSNDYSTNYSSRYYAMHDAADTDYRAGLANLNTQSSQDEFDALLNVLIVDEGADVGDPAVIAALNTLTTAQNNLAAALTTLTNEIGIYTAGVDVAVDSNQDIMNALVASGEISVADRAAVLAVIVSVAINEQVNFSLANANYSINNVSDERNDYLSALVATGVNTNRGPVRSALEDYEDAIVNEINEEGELDNIFNNNVATTFDSFFGAQYDLIDQYDVVTAAEGDVTTAQAVVSSADSDLSDVEVILADNEQDLVEAQAEVDGSEALLDPVEASYNLALVAYNNALAAYNLATTTVNNSDALINYLDVATVEQAYNTVRFVRGEEGIAGFRSRTIDYDDDGELESWLLGDIVHSSPSLVGAPNDLYDAKYRDTTYGAFREQYKDRRNVLYVGANDGMLHAFNAGFWDLDNKTFNTSNSFVGGSATAHPLGSEIWSYVPRAVLPHLQWMTDPNYAHSYYVDGDPITFDANMFPSDATHPYGWGTVLIVGMRFGGGDIRIDSNADGTDDTTVSSSYVLFDITDPEQAPTLIAEISDPGLGFTTSVPTVVKKRTKGSSYRNTLQNDWYVAFGSGPTELDDASSTQDAGLYLYDLRAKAFVSGFAPKIVGSAGFVGDISSFDDGGDFVDDALYFGFTGGSPSAASTGSLLRALLDEPVSSSTSTVINTGEPILSAPTVQIDRYGRRRITFGTGRLFMAPDNVTTEDRNYYGVVEPVDSAGELTYATIVEADLENVTDITVYDSGAILKNGSVLQMSTSDGVENVETFKQLVQAIRLHRDGWVLELDGDGAAPSERNISRGAIANNVLFFTSYTPSTNTCFPEGTSKLYGIDVRTGTAIPFEVFATDDDPDVSEGNVVDISISLGQGLASAPIVIQNAGGTTVFTSKSTTEQVNQDVRTNAYLNGRQSWRQLLLE